MSRRRSEGGHELTIIRTDDDDYYTRCSCGWIGHPYYRETLARQDGSYHLHSAAIVDRRAAS